MFQLSVVEHIRLSFGDVVCSYKAHTSAAEKLARQAWQMKTTVLALLGGAVITGTSAIVGTARAFSIVAAVMVGIAFVAYASYLALDFDPRVYAHRSCAARFWLLCEKYRALLTEIHDGVLQTEEVKDRRDALSLLLNSLQAAQKELQRPLSDDEELQVLQRERKRRVEAAEAFRAGGREEQADDEEYELEVLAEFMPEQMSEEQIEEIIDDVISEVGATNIRDMGRVMAGVMHQVSGRADGSVVSQLVKEKLA